MINDIHIGPITIHMYGLMIAIGVFMAVTVASYRAKKQDLDDNVIFDLLVCAVIGGFLGTRVLYYLTMIPEIIADPSILWNFKEGYVVYGGIIGGVLVSFFYCMWKKQPFLKYFDLVMPEVVMAQGIGRLGCFFAGCCYGSETTLPIGITYTHSKFAPNNVSLLPTQLISCVGDLCIFVILLWYSKRKKADGCVGAMYLIIYSVGRFCIEFLRNDYRGSVGALSTSQFISIGTFLLGIVLYVILSRRGKIKNEDI